MNDKLGIQINIGDIIVYCAMNGDSTALRMGKVTKVDEKVTVRGVWDNSWCKENPSLFKKTTKLIYGDHIIVLDRNKIPQKYLDLFDVVIT